MMNHIGKCIVGTILLLSSCVELTGQQRAEMDDESELVEAWTAAQILVTRQLKSPGTAEWGGLFAGDYQDPREAVTKLEENLCEVRGWVDSQNSFGGIVRTNFYLKIKKTENGWALVGPISTAQN